MEAFTLAELGDTPEPKEECSPSDDRITELTKIGAAFAVNCTENLDKHLAAGRNAGISEEDIAEIAKLAGFIRGKASSHVDKKVSVEEEEQEQSRPMAMAGGRSCC